jgi:pimeloyl-ACP methyl ester carboxylesterase
VERRADAVERWAEAAPGVRLRVEDVPGPGDAVLLVADADTPGLAWPDELVALLARHHRVIRYDHRDTGRSTRTPDEDEQSYAVTDLAADALAVLDACGAGDAHLVGMGMGGTLVQLLLLDHPDRVRSATLVGAAALGAEGLPGPDPALLRLWAEIDDPRDERGELAWRVEHWRLLHGTGAPFDPLEFRALEQRLMADAGRPDRPAVHAHAARDGLDRGAELASVAVPVLVVEAPDDPVHPPPHAEHLARALGGAPLVRIPGMGHAVSRAVVGPLAAAVLSRTLERRPR